VTRILVDLLFYSGTKGGMESYARRLYSRMPPTFEFIGLASSELAATDYSWFPGEVVDSGLKGENRRAWATGELTAVARRARRLGADLIHSPANIGPWTSRVPLVLTVHDLLPFRHPEFVPGPYAPVLRALVRGAARNARRILTVSSSSKADIVSILGRSDDDIDVVPLAGADSAPTNRPAHDRRSPFLLSVGNRLPHKNFESLIRAMSLIPAPTRPRLIITGSHRSDPLGPQIHHLGLEDWVELRGWVPTGELESLYARATAVVVPTLFEGFGLPVLEAMEHSCPVICSDIPPLREVAGRNAAYFDPTQPESIARAITKSIASPGLLDSLAAAGRERSANFSWAQTAAGTTQSFERALS
jgi:glycosyltransferase involved in cell wall biosynthesis